MLWADDQGGWSEYLRVEPEYIDWPKATNQGNRD
jgi:hypothetical protein